MFRTFLNSQRTLQRASPLGRYFVRPQPSLTSFIHTGTSLSYSKEADALPPTFAEKYNLYDPTRWVPITVGSFVFASTIGLYHWDAESQMMGLFALFVATVYSQGGEAIGKYFDDEAEAILSEIRAAEDTRIKILQDRLAEVQKFTAVDQDIVTYVDTLRKLKTDMATAAPNRFEQRRTKFFLAKLERVLRQEADYKENFNKTLIAKATADATSKFQENEGLQRQSLSAALSWLEAPEGQKKEMTEVGDLFTNFFQAVKADPSITADIEAKLKSEMDKIVNGEKFEVVDEYLALQSASN